MTVLRLAVLVLFASEDQSRSGRDVEAILADELAGRHRIRRITEEERFVLGTDLDRAVLACGSDLGCAARRLRPLRADRALVVLVNELVEPTLIDIRLLDLTNEKSVATDVRPFLPSEPLVAQIRSRAASLFDTAGHKKLARLRIRTEPPKAAVTIDPPPDDPLADRVVSVPPGSYVVTAVLEGYQPSEATVDVTANGEHEVVLRLEEQSSLLSSLWFWGGAATVTVGAVIAVVVLSRAGGGTCYCVEAPGGSCTGC